MLNSWAKNEQGKRVQITYSSFKENGRQVSRLYMVLGVSTRGLLKSMGSDGAFFENTVMQ